MIQHYLFYVLLDCTDTILDSREMFDLFKKIYQDCGPKNIGWNDFILVFQKEYVLTGKMGGSVIKALLRLKDRKTSTAEIEKITQNLMHRFREQRGSIGAGEFLPGAKEALYKLLESQSVARVCVVTRDNKSLIQNLLDDNGINIEVFGHEDGTKSEIWKALSKSQPEGSISVSAGDLPTDKGESEVFLGICSEDDETGRERALFDAGAMVYSSLLEAVNNMNEWNPRISVYGK